MSNITEFITGFSEQKGRKTIYIYECKGGYQNVVA